MTTLFPRATPGRKNYLVGFFLCLFITIVVFGFSYVNQQEMRWAKDLMILAIMLCAALQLVVQVVFFLHIGEDAKPRWKSISFAFTSFVILILVGGSLWIMYNLNYHTMTQTQMYEYIETQNKKGF